MNESFTHFFYLTDKAVLKKLLNVENCSLSVGFLDFFGHFFDDISNICLCVFAILSNDQQNRNTFGVDFLTT